MVKNAVAQKSPCERNRVIMGQESPIQLGQRRQDARQEVPMRTPKPLYAHERMIYRPELLTCPHCGDLLVPCNYLAWDKTVQRLARARSGASRQSRCPHATCAGSRLRLLSAEGQRLAPAGSTYGYDVVVHIGWGRQEGRATYREIHAALPSRVRISESHVGYLYQQVSLPLLACHERQHRDRLAQIAQQQGGLVVALEGLAPQGGGPQIWFIRELSSGLTLRSGWLCQQDQPTFEAFLEPLKHLEWPILAVLSDQQTGLVPAVTTVLPHSRYQFCQAHYLRHLAEPLAEADAAFKQIIDDAGVKTPPPPPRSPWLNAFAERWVKSVKDEALARVILFGERSLYHVLGEYVEHYHAERPYHGKGNVIPFPAPRAEGAAAGPIGCRERLGGLLKYYHRKAA